MSLIKKESEIENIKKAGVIVAEVLAALEKRALPGITLKELDTLALALIKTKGGSPSFLNYQPYGADKPYPATICASVNDVVVHGIPTKYALQDGDLLKIDCGAVVNGYHADAAITVAVGSVSDISLRLMEAVDEALKAGITVACAGNTLGDIGHAIHETVKKFGFSVADGLTGHGVGSALHEDPVVWNKGERGAGMKLKAGMVLALEPMIAAGSSKVYKRSDDSYAMRDGSLSAHKEHTIVVRDGEAEITTK